MLHPGTVDWPAAPGAGRSRIEEVVIGVGGHLELQEHSLLFAIEIGGPADVVPAKGFGQSSPHLLNDGFELWRRFETICALGVHIGYCVEAPVRSQWRQELCCHGGCSVERSMRRERRGAYAVRCFR
jgi:hypothetical protein